MRNKKRKVSNNDTLWPSTPLLYLVFDPSEEYHFFDVVVSASAVLDWNLKRHNSRYPSRTKNAVSPCPVVVHVAPIFEIDVFNLYNCFSICIPLLKIYWKFNYTNSRKHCCPDSIPTHTGCWWLARPLCVPVPIALFSFLQLENRVKQISDSHVIHNYHRHLSS